MEEKPISATEDEALYLFSDKRLKNQSKLHHSPKQTNKNMFLPLVICQDAQVWHCRPLVDEVGITGMAYDV